VLTALLAALVLGAAVVIAAGVLGTGGGKAGLACGSF
jgi:hypothetical protein